MEELRWPPIRKGLERLYLKEKLSAAKIARVYGLKYPNPKSGETLVLYYLKKFGIARRDSAEHVRKVTPQMVNQRVERYKAGESLRQIAGTTVTAVTVWGHLRKRGLRLRDKVDAQIDAVTKHSRRPFMGIRSEEAYLIGFARGDLNVSLHGRAVRVKTATTHPLMVELIRRLLGESGLVRVTPRHSGLAGYEWNIQVDLDATFSFLLDHRQAMPSWVFGDDLFWSFLAGIFDAEGSITHNYSATYGFQASITNSDRILLDRICEALRAHGFRPYMGFDRRSSVWKVQLWRKDEVEKLLTFMPLKHPEKVAKTRLALRFGRCQSIDEHRRVIEGWGSIIEEIRAGRDKFVHEAKARIDAMG